MLSKNGRVVTATDDDFADVFTNGETIAQTGRALNVLAASNDGDRGRRSDSSTLPVDVVLTDGATLRFEGVARDDAPAAADAREGAFVRCRGHAPNARAVEPVVALSADGATEDEGLIHPCTAERASDDVVASATGPSRDEGIKGQRR